MRNPIYSSFKSLSYCIWAKLNDIDEVMITDKNGLKHIYEVMETEVVNPYDNSIKTQGTEKELTLFTCSQKGTMRFVVRCIYKEAVMDE